VRSLTMTTASTVEELVEEPRTTRRATSLIVKPLLDFSVKPGGTSAPSWPVVNEAKAICSRGEGEAHAPSGIETRIPSKTRHTMRASPARRTCMGEIVSAQGPIETQ